MLEDMNSRNMISVAAFIHSDETTHRGTWSRPKALPCFVSPNIRTKCCSFVTV